MSYGWANRMAEELLKVRLKRPRVLGSLPKISIASFQTRSRTRDDDSDRLLFEGVSNTINDAIEKLEAERVGLQHRLDETISRAAIIGGNDIDDHRTRTEELSRVLRSSDSEIRSGQRRIHRIEENLRHLRFIDDRNTVASGSIINLDA